MRFKNLTISIIIALSYLVSIGLYSQSGEKKFRLEIEMPVYKGETVFFANYYQGDTYKLDSCSLTNKGIGVLEIDIEKVPAGQYLLFVKPDFRMEMLIDEDQSDIKVSIPKDISKSTVVGSPDTQGYWDYLNKVKIFEEEIEALGRKLEAAKTEDQKIKIYSEIEKVGENIDNLTKETAEKNNGTFLGAYLKGMIRLDLPDELKNPSASRGEVRKYVQDHYLDNLDLTDPRLQRTNYFYSLIDSYLNNWIDQSWEVIPAEYSRLVAKTQSNKEAFDGLLSAFLTKSLSSPIMGMENVWARLAEDYIFDKEIDMAEADVKKLQERYELIKQNRIGMIAQDLAIKTINGDSINLMDIEAEYIILEFYNPTCSFCRQDLTALAKEFYPKYKDKGVRIVAFNLGDLGSAWNDFVKDCGMEEFYNCSDPDFKSEYWLKYNTSRVPTNYILDKNKKIIGKSINKSNLEKLFEIINKNGIN